MEIEVNYQVFVNGEWTASSDDLSDVRHYALMYSDEGEVKIYKCITFKTPVQ